MTERPLLIDATRLVARALQGLLPTGVDRVALAYLEHFRGRARLLVRWAGRWAVLDGADSALATAALLRPEAASPWRLRWCVARAWAQPWRDGGGGLFLNPGHSGLELPGYGRRLRRLAERAVFFLHDLIPITHPEYSRAGEAERHWRRLETMVGCGQGLILNSQATGAALAAAAAERGWRLPPCTVAPLAPARLPPPERRPLLPWPYFVVLGTVEPRKNHLLLLQLWRRLAEERGAAAPRLVVIGRRGWECEQVADVLDRCPALTSLVIERPRCGDAELATWLAHARALLFPSFVEGYGIPLVEALALGVPVIASDLAVFREVAGDVPDYADPLDGPAWRRLILEHLDDCDGLARRQRRRMAEFRPPTWAGHFAAVESLFARIGVSV